MDNSYLRWLNTQGPVTKDTSSRLAQRWSSVTPVSSISKVSSVLSVPAFQYLIPISSSNVPFQIGQYNYTAPSPFTITDFSVRLADRFGKAFFGIRYRIGNVGVRYLFANHYTTMKQLGMPYSGQVIQPNFCIEAYAYNGLYIFPTNIVAFDGGSINTSLLSDPTSLPASTPIISPAGAFVTGITKALPVALPYSWGQQAEWLTN